MTDRSSRQDELLPWHADAWEQLMRARRSHRLPHALLLTGPVGVGKRAFLDRLVGSLLCHHPNERQLACGQCADCGLLAAGTHPDRVEIGPDEEGKSREIKVSAIRDLAATDSLTAHRGGWKLIQIDPAHRMNASAANAVLKTLEEPAPNTLICLVSEQPGRLPATIRSRCQTLRIPVPAESEALAWLVPRLKVGEPRTLLRLAHGAPLRALELADEGRLSLRDSLFEGFVQLSRATRDPVAEAAAWNKHEPAIVLDWLGGWISDLLRSGSGHPEPVLINPDKAVDLSALAANLDAEAVHRYLRRVWGASGEDLSNLNRQLLYESLLVDLTRVIRPVRDARL